MHSPRCRTGLNRILLKIMPVRKTLLLVVALFLIVLGSQLAVAQQVTRYDVFGGYSYLRLDSKSYGFANDSNLQGAELAGAYNITPHFSGILDLGAHFAQNEHFYSFMAGGQAAIKKYHGRLFAQALFGKARNAYEIPTVPSNLGRSLAFGGGYDLPFRKRFSIRVFQVDYISTHTYSANQNNLRFSAGLVFHLGKTVK